MKTYIGSKVVTASAMNRADYNTLRGWTLPDDEDGADEGYLVEDANDSKPNHPDYKGYISWSPTEQFERIYIELCPENSPRILDASLIKLTAAMQSDMDYAWGWHCNIAMAAFDAGCPHDVANEGAARFMKMLFNVDTRKHEWFSWTQKAKTAIPDTPLEAVTFSGALEALKKGLKVARKGWNGKGLSVRIIYAGNALCHGENMKDCFGLSDGKGGIQPGWVPSTGDCMAEDWAVVG
jgi:hypothetical protein